MLLKVVKKFYSNEGGQGLVQFAMVLPVLIIMLSMVVDLSRVINAKVLVNSAASECARYVVEKADEPGTITSYIDHIIKVNYGDRLDTSKLNAELSNATGVYTEKYTYHKNISDKKGINATIKYYDMKITVTYELDLVMPLSKLIFGGNTFKISSFYQTRIGVK